MANSHSTAIKKSLLVAGGLIALLLGVIGIFVPLLPTVPLVLLSGYCFARSSGRLHNWLLTHPMFGRIIRDFESGRGVSRVIKVRAILLIALSMGISAWLIGKPLVWAILAGVGGAVSLYIWRLPEPGEAPDPAPAARPKGW